MSVVSSNVYCLPCEQYEHRLELRVRDQHNKPFNNIKATVKDASGATYPVILGENPIILEKLAPGKLSIYVDKDSWLKDAKSRPSFKGDISECPTKVWHSENPTDAVGGELEFINATMADFLAPEDREDLDLPPRHQAGAQGELKLFAAMSAVVTIQGFDTVSLRFGIFFDGTCNNTYSAKWGKEQFDSIKDIWKSRVNKSGRTGEKDRFGYAVQYQAKLEYMPDNCCVPKKFVDGLEGSATNEVTNVQKMFDLYKNNQFSEDGETYYHAEYVTGIGTDNNKSGKSKESVLVGQGFGIGDWGVASKTQTGIEQICDDLPTLLVRIANDKSNPKVVDAINKVEFDVYGFSRGAAAARDFINHVFDGEQGAFVQAFTNTIDGKVKLCDGFDWSQNEYCEVMFAGLFDTVPSVVQPLSLDMTTHNDINPDIRQWLDPDRVKRAVHLVANSRTEYRFNFSLLKLNDADKPHFDEITVAGAHSDIGGGYYSSVAFGEHENIKYWLPMYEKKYIDSVSYPTGFFTNYDAVRKKASQTLSEERNRQLHQGWLEDNVLIKTELNAVQNRYVGQLEYINTPEGDLSRLYLRVMYGLSEHAGVPVSDVLDDGTVWTTQKTSDAGWELYYPVKKQITYKGQYQNVAPYEFGALCERVLEEAKQGKTDTLQSRTGDSAIPTFFRLGLIHHSTDESLSVAVRPFGANVESLNLSASDKQRLDEEKALSQCELNCDFGDGYYRRAEFECVQGK